jgi:hypothetical protein
VFLRDVGFIEADAGGGTWSAWVAAVVAQRDSELTGPARLSAPMTRLRRQAMTCGAVPVRCAELLGVDLTTLRKLAAKVEPYIRAGGTSIWSLAQLERQLRPEAYGRRRGGYLDRRRPRPSQPGRRFD